MLLYTMMYIKIHSYSLNTLFINLHNFLTSYMNVQLLSHQASINENSMKNNRYKLKKSRGKMIFSVIERASCAAATFHMLLIRKLNIITSPQWNIVSDTETWFSRISLFPHSELGDRQSAICMTRHWQIKYDPILSVAGSRKYSSMSEG